MATLVTGTADVIDLVGDLGVDAWTNPAARRCRRTTWARRRRGSTRGCLTGTGSTSPRCRWSRRWPRCRPWRRSPGRARSGRAARRHLAQGSCTASMSQVAPASAAVLARPCRVCDGASMAAGADLTDMAALADFEDTCAQNADAPTTPPGRMSPMSASCCPSPRTGASATWASSARGPALLARRTGGPRRGSLDDRPSRRRGRTFLRWAARTGRIDVDPSLRLAAPRRSRSLPGVQAARGERHARCRCHPRRRLGPDPRPGQSRAGTALCERHPSRSLVALDVDDVDLDQQSPG